MLGSNLHSFPKAALVVASLVLTVGATPSLPMLRSKSPSQEADMRRPAQHAGAVHSGADQSGNAGKCLGGYVWTQRSFSVHRTENQMALPLPCR